MPSNTQEIKEKLNEFIRKYYLQQWVVGLLFSLVQLSVLFLVINYIEHFFWLNTTTRGFFFYGWWIAFIGILGIQVVKPLLKFLGKGNRLSNEDAAKIIGSHFPEIQDKLLNLLQLEQMSLTTDHSEFLVRSIEQKTVTLKRFSFINALDWASYRKSLKRFALLLLVFLSWGMYDSSTISAATKRWVEHNTKFVKTAPFQFVLLNNDLLVSENEDLDLKLKLTGNEIPTTIVLQIDGQNIEMQNTGRNTFSYSLKQLRKNTAFRFVANDFNSDEHIVKVQKLPKWGGISLRAIYPAHISKASQEINAYEEISVPEGTLLEWRINTLDADELNFLQKNAWKKYAISAKTILLKTSCNLIETVKASIKKECRTLKDTFQTSIIPIKDEYPIVSVEKGQSQDNENVWHFSGFATDDYKVQSIKFYYRVLAGGKENNALSYQEVSIQQPMSSESVFQHTLNVQSMNVKPGDEIEYYFQASDNDAPNGYKKTRTSIEKIKRLGEDQYRELVENSKEQLEKQLANSQQNAKKLSDASKKIEESLRKSSSMNFDEKSKVKDWANQQQKQLDLLKDALKQQEKVNRQQKELKLEDPELKERREELQQRMERLEDPEMQKLLNELKELLDKNAPNEDVQKAMKDVESSFQESQKEMESLMEQLKELRLEEGIKDQAKQLKEWAQKEEKLAEQTKNANLKDAKEKGNIENALKEQAQKLEELKQRMAELKEQNKELEKPMPLDLGEKPLDEAKKANQEAQDKLGQNKKQESEQKQKEAQEKAEEAQEKMEESLQKAKEEQTAEDLHTLRALLENLIVVSKKQEDVFTELSQLKSDNPRVLALNKQQIQIKELSLNIEDSLRALAKRQPMVSDMVTREIAKVNSNMDLAFQKLKIRDIRNSSMYEQYVMTGYNNLAVMLMESLKNVQQKMNQQSNSKSKKSKSCSTPKNQGNSGKGSKGKDGKLSESQKKLGEMLQKMQQGSQKGNGQTGKQGENKKPGNSGEKQGEGKGKRGLSQELVETALMQEQLRRDIEKLKKEALKQGNSGMSENLHQVDKLMEQQERDLINGKLTPQLIERNKEILTRLLEHEKAERQQGEEDKRESNNAKVYSSTPPPELKAVTLKKLKEKEMLRRKPAQLNEYYQKTVDDYLRLANP
jgi:hypothetical protein